MCRLCIGYVSVMCRRRKRASGVGWGSKSDLWENKNEKFANIRKNQYLCREYWIWGIGYGVLDMGYGIWGIGYWILDIGYL